MNVYINKSNHPYVAGMIVVAANSIDEAHGLAILYLKKIYPYNHWKLVEGLVYNGTEPKVIEENSYVE